MTKTARTKSVTGQRSTRRRTRTPSRRAGRKSGFERQPNAGAHARWPSRAAYIYLCLVGHGVRQAFPSAFATPPGVAHVHHMPSAELFRQNLTKGSRYGRSRGELRRTADCRSPCALDRLSCSAERIRLVSILHRSITFESSWPACSVIGCFYGIRRQCNPRRLHEELADLTSHWRFPSPAVPIKRHPQLNRRREVD